MKFEFYLIDIAVLDSQAWLGILAIEFNEFDGHLFYMEYDGGYWKFDLLFLRSLWLKLKDK